MFSLTRIFTLFMIVCASLTVQAEEGQDAQASAVIEKLQKPLYNPFVERYLLDEVKGLRTDIQNQRAEFSEKFAQTQLEVSDRAINYTTNTVNNIFYVIAAAASILALVGWTSLRDIRNRLNEVVEHKVAIISDEYEKRLYELEQKLKDRTESIISAQEEISQTNTIHSLWMRAGLEATSQAKIEVYDQILAFNPEDVEALTYKADAVLDIGEAEWALNLCNKALSINPDYPYAHYQRACANATLDQIDAAMIDLKQAIDLSSTYLEEAKTDKNLERLLLTGKINQLIAT
jgi:tetratricopeptide (TPR) repeat protein